MKKIVLTMMAAFMMTCTAMAQEETTKERKQFSQTEMIQHRTQSMVKKYGLDESQAAKLMELNTKYADKMPGRGFGQRPNGRRGQRPDSLSRDQKGVRPAQLTKDKKFNKEQSGKRPNFAETKKVMDEYNAELKSIMTEEQYKAFTSDREKMMQRGPRR